MHLLILIVAVALLWHYGKIGHVTGFIGRLWNESRLALCVIGLVGLVWLDPSLGGSTILLGCAIAGVFYMARRHH